jgi:RNA polymerase sigma factor (sigma-70 family)
VAAGDPFSGGSRQLTGGARDAQMTSLPSHEWSNARLVEECVRGNEQAWFVLVDRYKNLLYSIPLRYGAPQQDAADIFQAVCLDLFNELPRIRDAEALQGWLIRVTTHKCHHWKRRQGPPCEDLREQDSEMRSPAELPPDLLMELEREQLLRDAVAQLPPRCREMIGMLFFQQPPLPYTEVAHRLRLATGSIGFIRGRCLKRLKRILEEKGF